jgi:hypothetical protein
MKPLTEKQIKAAWIVAAILIAVHFGPTVIGSVARQFAPAVPSKPSAAIPYPPPPVKPALPPGLSPQMQAAYLGIWQGAETLPNNDQCRVRLEIRLSPDQPGQVSGYETRNCFALSQLTTGKLPQGGLAQMFKDVNPVSTVLIGSAIQDDLTFRVDKTIGTAPDICPMSSYAVSRFGDQSIVAQWKGSCATGEGQMVLTRYRG